MDRWSNCVAIVTGASAGMGWAIARALLDANLFVVGLARRHERMVQLREQQLADATQRQRFTPIACDLSNLDSIRAAFAEIETLHGSRGVHVLINAAGMASYTRILDENNEAALQRSIDVNLMGAVHCTKQAYALMQRPLAAGEPCHVVNVCGLFGHRIPKEIANFRLNLYPVAKHALRALNEVLRREFQPHKLLLRLSSISPGLTETEFLEAAARNAGEPTKVPSVDLGGSLLKPEDVARGIIFILGSPQHVNVAELLMVPTAEDF